MLHEREGMEKIPKAAGGGCPLVESDPGRSRWMISYDVSAGPA